MKLAIYGYGNLGKGVEYAIKQNPDATLTGIFTRRDPAAVRPVGAVPVYPAAEIQKHAGEFDVLIICGGRAYRGDQSGYAALRHPAPSYQVGEAV